MHSFAVITSFEAYAYHTQFGVHCVPYLCTITLLSAVKLILLECIWNISKQKLTNKKICIIQKISRDLPGIIKSEVTWISIQSIGTNKIHYPYASWFLVIRHLCVLAMCVCVCYCVQYTGRGMWPLCCSWLCAGITATVEENGSSWRQAYTNSGFSPTPESPEHLCKACGGHFDTIVRKVRWMWPSCIVGVHKCYSFYTTTLEKYPTVDWRSVVMRSFLKYLLNTQQFWVASLIRVNRVKQLHKELSLITETCCMFWSHSVVNVTSDIFFSLTQFIKHILQHVYKQETVVAFVNSRGVCALLREGWGFSLGRLHLLRKKDYCTGCRRV